MTDEPMAEVTISLARKIGLPNYSNAEVFSCVKIRTATNEEAEILKAQDRAETYAKRKLEKMVEEIHKANEPQGVKS